MLKQHQAAQAPDNEAVELLVEPLLNPLAQPAVELIPQTSQNPKDKPKTKPKAKPKSVSEGMIEEPKEEGSDVEEVPQKGENKHDGSGQAVECKQHSEPIHEEQGEENNKRVRTG